MVLVASDILAWGNDICVKNETVSQWNCVYSPLHM
jgi:hypothetical protein